MPEFSMFEIDHIMGGVSLEEGKRLAHYAALVPADQVIVEVGSHGGSSACWLAMGAKKGAGAVVYAVDLWDSAGGDRREEYANAAALRRFEAQIEYCVAANLMEAVIPMKGESSAVAKSWAGRSIGLLHIDGSHTVEACSADIRAWTPHVAPGGVVICHDYSRPGPHKAVGNLLVPPDWECLGTFRWGNTRMRGQWIGRRVA